MLNPKGFLIEKLQLEKKKNQHFPWAGNEAS